MPVEQDFAFVIKHHANKTNIFIVGDTTSQDRIPPRAEQYASYVISEGKLTIKHDQFDAIAQPEIYEAVMRLAARVKDHKNGEIRCVINKALSDYINDQIEQD